MHDQTPQVHFDQTPQVVTDSFDQTPQVRTSSKQVPTYQVQASPSLLEITLGLRRPQFSWTRIKGESDVKGGGGHGWVEASAGSGVGADPAAVGAGVLAPGQRWSASRKRDVVLRLLRGESLEMVSREVGVELYRLEAWQARALAGLELGLKAQGGEPLAAELDAAKRHIGELSMEIELLRERARAAECRLPLATRRSRR